MHDDDMEYSPSFSGIGFWILLLSSHLAIDIIPPFPYSLRISSWGRWHDDFASNRDEQADMYIHSLFSFDGTLVAQSRSLFPLPCID